VQTTHLVDGKYAEPERCPGQGCRGKKFTVDKTSARCVDWQRVRLQELSRDAVDDEGRVPRFADVELEGALCDACSAGDIVTVLGVAEMMSVEVKGSALERQRNASLFEIYIKAISVVKKRGAGEEHSAQPLSAAAAAAFSAGLPDIAAEDAYFGKGGRGGGAEGGGGGWTSVPGFVPDAVDKPELTPNDLEFIVRFTEECAGEQFKQLVHSLCPTIYGHEMVKAGLVLALFGGVRKNIGGGGDVPVRGSIHCLVVGDPGLGKSQMLKAVSSVAPRGMYVSGRSVSKAGLTATVVKDPGTGGHTFEAGAMVLSDGGVCCVDEFDKMPNEHKALLEAMEQQSVSVAKAGLTATLPSRAAVVAAANPVQGVYNRSKTVNDNLKMSLALLSRFDLCFILMDTPDDELDEHLSHHVLAPHGRGGALRLKQAQQKLLAYHAHAHAEDEEDELAGGVFGGVFGGGGGMRRKKGRAGGRREYGEEEDDPDVDGRVLDAAANHAYTQATQGGGGAGGGGAGAGALAIHRVMLRRRLRLDLGGAAADFAPLPHSLMRKYIAYATAYCHPRLTHEAGEVLQAFYLELRARSGAGADGPPITPRQLESLIRLAEARAKVELRERVTVEDAKDAVEVMKESMRDVLSDDRGKVRFGRGSGKSTKRGKAKMFVEAMNQRAVERESAYFTAGELYSLADDLQLQLPDVDGFIDSLNLSGEILKSGRMYKSASCDGAMMAGGGGGRGGGGGGGRGEF
jgi:DNA helicase MCM8